MKKFILYISSILLCSTISLRAMTIANDFAFTEEKNNFSLKAEILSSDECKKLFKGRTTLSGKDSIYPVKLTLQNKSDKVYGFNLGGIDLKLATEKEVIEKLKINTIWWKVGAFGLSAAAALIGGMFFLPIPILYVAGVYITSSVLFSGSLFIIFPVAFGSAAFGSGYCYSKNSSINQFNKELEGSVNYIASSIVSPGKTENILFFVKKADFKNSFKVSLFNGADQEEKLHFDVAL